jgi:hypothetical protein
MLITRPPKPLFCVLITSVKIALFPPPMPIVKKGGVVYEYDVEGSDIDFGYIQIFPPGLWP